MKREANFVDEQKMASSVTESIRRPGGATMVGRVGKFGAAEVGRVGKLCAGIDCVGKGRRADRRLFLKRKSFLSFVLLASLASLKPSDGQGIKISGTFLSDTDQSRVTATGNSCRQGFPCGKYGQTYYWCWTSYRNGGDWDYCCAPESACGKHGMNYMWCWADTSKNTWSYCKVIKSKAKTTKSETTPRPTTTTTTTTTTRRRTTTTRPPTTRRTYTVYTQPTIPPTRGGTFNKQILDNVKSAVKQELEDSKRDIINMDMRMQRLQNDVNMQEERIQKLDKVEETQQNINTTLAKITKWIRYLSTTVDDLNGMKETVRVLATENAKQKNSGMKAQMNYALKNNELDNNSYSRPNYFYQKKVPTALKSSQNSSERASRALAEALCLSLLGFMTLALFDALSGVVSRF